MKTYSASYQNLGGILSYLLFLSLVIIYVTLLPEELSQQRLTGTSEQLLQSSSSLLEHLRGENSTLKEARSSESIPRVFSINLPRDLDNLPFATKNSLFISIILPNVLKANERILWIRKKIIRLSLQEKQEIPFAAVDREWLKMQAKYYSTRAETSALLQRVDIIPVSLAIAQAITESGWGGSRFAMTGNAMYGQHLSKSSSGRFILSRQGNVKVAAFDSIYECTISYMHNLNTSKAYRPLREIRSRLRQEQKWLNGHSMAQGLKLYSQLGEEYVQILQQIITKYELTNLEHTTLDHLSAHVLYRFPESSE